MIAGPTPGAPLDLAGLGMRAGIAASLSCLILTDVRAIPGVPLSILGIFLLHPSPKVLPGEQELWNTGPGRLMEEEEEEAGCTTTEQPGSAGHR